MFIIMEYTILIQTDFGELKVEFQTNYPLESDQVVFDKAMKILGNSNDILLKDRMLSDNVFYDVVQGMTIEEISADI